jgi:hypothetical protein
MSRRWLASRHPLSSMSAQAVCTRHQSGVAAVVHRRTPWGLFRCLVVFRDDDSAIPWGLDRDQVLGGSIP